MEVRKVEGGNASAFNPCMASETKPAAGRKRRFDIHVVLRRIPFVACIISSRTRDEVSFPTAIRLLERAPTPAAVAKLG